MLPNGGIGIGSQRTEGPSRALRARRAILLWKRANRSISLRLCFKPGSKDSRFLGRQVLRLLLWHRNGLGNGDALGNGAVLGHDASLTAIADAQAAAPGPDGGLSFAIAKSYVDLNVVYRWVWTRDGEEPGEGEEDLEPPTRFQLKLAATSVEHDVEAIGAEDGQSFGSGGESVAMTPQVGGSFAMDGDSIPILIYASAAGDRPTAIRLPRPRDIEATSRGTDELIVIAQASCFSEVKAYGIGTSVKVKKQEAKFGAMTLTPQ